MSLRLPVAALWFAAAALPLSAVSLADEERERFSYAIGFQIGHGMLQQGLDIDTDALAQAIEDVLTDAEPRYTMEEMQAAVMQREQRMQDEMNAVAENNLARGDAFRAEYAGRDGVVETDSGLQYQEIEAGSGEQPTLDDTVLVHYRGALIDGEVFDSSHERGEPISLPLNGVIPGWQEALLLMREGATWQLVIPPQLAYGPRGAPPRIGPNETLVFDVELIEIQ